MDYKKELAELVQIILDEGASDLHLAEGRQPIMRVSGFLLPIVKKTVLTRENMEGLVKALMQPNYHDQYIRKRSVDFSYEHPDGTRFRGNGYFSLGKMSMALRLIPKHIKTLKELGLPEDLVDFANRRQGFFLVVGPTGQGKSTTLAALIDYINTERFEKILTIEDPIEYVFESKKSIIDQREVGEDSLGFQDALHDAFREDVNVIMIGEMRELETISTAVTAAETGHLVFSTLHTNSAAQTVTRIIDSFPSDQQKQIRVQLAASLIGVLSQRLVPRVSGGQIPAYEIMINNTAVANLIRENRTHELDSVIETSSELGMLDFNRSLTKLTQMGEITIETAYKYSQNLKGLERMLQGS